MASGSTVAPFSPAPAGSQCRYPFLEAMLPVGAQAQTGGKLRYVLVIQGISQSSDTSVGSQNFEPIRTLGLENDVTFVQGLKINGSGPAPSSGNFHYGILSPLYAGVGTPSGGGHLQSTTIDQMVVQEWGSDLLHVSTQTRPPNGRSYTNLGRTEISHTGRGVVSPIESPFAAWDRLFSGLPSSPGPAPTPSPTPTPPTTPTGPTAAERNAQRRLSVLDVARTRAESLRSVVSAQDWRRMDEHFTAIRELEVKLEDLLNNPTGNGGSGGGGSGGSGSGGTGGGSTGGGGASGCVVPPMPTDPARGPRWSNETLRGEIFADMIPLAFACDLTQVANWMITWQQSNLPALHITGEPEDLHWITHNDPSDGRGRRAHQGEYTAWHVNQYARLIRNLKETTDGTTGAPLFDTTVATMIFESVAGHGFGTSGMTALIAGRPSAINLGTTVQGDYPGELFNTSLRAVDIQRNHGNFTGVIPGLLR